MKKSASEKPFAPKKEEKKEKKEKKSGSFSTVLNKILSQDIPKKCPILSMVKLKKVKSTKEKALPTKCNNKEWEDMCRVKPSVLDREKEKRLQRIATRGVIALFNSVKQQQQTQAKVQRNKRGKLVKTTVSKGEFLDKIKSQTMLQKKLETDGQADDSTWKILRDDYMMDASTKNWDKDDDDES